MNLAGLSIWTGLFALGLYTAPWGLILVAAMLWQLWWEYRGK